ncbi:MAG: hypothetical protein Q7T14_11055 [Aestuariivirga sp.]|nr:hypothetical protein [Aestuariivirga sp.]
MNQNTAGALNQYPNLIELIGRQCELHGTAMWWQQAIGSDELSDGAGLDPLPDTRENFLQDEMNGPLNAVSVSGREVIGQDEVLPLGFEAIGQDEIQSPQASGLDGMSICNDEVLLQDEAPALDRISICSDETTIGQDEISGSPPAYGRDRMSICNDENFLQDEIVDIAHVGTASAS